MTWPAWSRAIQHHWVASEGRRLEMSEGRQDVNAPPPTIEKSDPTPVDNARGMRLWVGYMAVGAIMIAIIIYFIVTR
jgi:hypothetical protein